jgi:16S rRNA (guanine527-N7)-methyltransferase
MIATGLPVVYYKTIRFSHDLTGVHMGPLQLDASSLGINLDDAQVEMFRLYHQELALWNNHFNLTAVIEWDKVQTRHILDSLTASIAIPQNVLEGGTAIDVGSGGGFPGLPLKIAFPNLHVTLLDSNAKKTSFLRHVSQTLGLRNVFILTGRAEELAHQSNLRESFDLVLSRAVTRLPVLAELTLPFCNIGGSAILHKGPNVDDEVSDARFAINSFGGTVKELLNTYMKESNRRATLVVLEKLRITPPRYPRRSGIPAKRPLTGPI